MNLKEKNIKSSSIFFVENSLLDRDIFLAVLENESSCRIVGHAPSANIGLKKIAQLKPDLVVFNLSVADMSPKEFMQILNQQMQDAPGVLLIVTQVLTDERIRLIIEALEYGAFDFIEIASNNNEEQKKEIFMRKFLPKLRSYSIQQFSRRALRLSNAAYATEKKNSVRPESVHKNIQARTNKPIKPSRISLIAIGVSTGGPEALANLISTLPQDFNVPIIIVLHMPEKFTPSMAQSLDRISPNRVKEAEDNERIEPAMIYLSKGGKHLRVSGRNWSDMRIKITDENPVHNCKPSVEVFFDSLVDKCNYNIISVLLTGMGEDGANAMGRLKQKGAITLAQDESSSVVWGMPGSAVKKGFVDEVLPLNAIANRLSEMCYEK